MSTTHKPQFSHNSKPSLTKRVDPGHPTAKTHLRPDGASGTRESKLQVAWVTNLAAPYRRPVWEKFGEQVDLSVLILDRSVSKDKGANRGDDWDLQAGETQNYHATPMATLKIKHRESRYYLATRLPAMGQFDALVLGGWESPAYWQIALAARRQGARLIGFYESHELSSNFHNGPIATVRSHWFRSLDAVVVPGSASHDSVIRMGVPEQRIFIGFNAVDVQTLAAQAHNHRTTALGHRFVYVGQLIPRKNLVTLLHAFALIHQPDDTLNIVGTGPQEPELRKLAEALNIQGNTTFRGHVPQADLGQIYGRSDTLVLPSLEEVWGLVVNEALACGLSVVVSDRTGVSPDVRHMAGVFESHPTATDIARAMSNARDLSLSPIRDPQILDYSPEKFASIFMGAVLSSNPRYRNSTARTIKTAHREER